MCFSILMVPHSPSLNVCPLSFWQSHLFHEYIVSSISQIWAFVSVLRMFSICLLANSYSSHKVLLGCFVLHAKHSLFLQAVSGLVVLLLCIYFCCSLFTLLYNCLLTCLLLFKKNTKIQYGKATFLQRHYVFRHSQNLKSVYLKWHCFPFFPPQHRATFKFESTDEDKRKVSLVSLCVFVCFIHGLSKQQTCFHLMVV